MDKNRDEWGRDEWNEYRWAENARGERIAALVFTGILAISLLAFFISVWYAGR